MPLATSKYNYNVGDPNGIYCHGLKVGHIHDESLALDIIHLLNSEEDGSMKTESEKELLELLDDNKISDTDDLQKLIEASEKHAANTERFEDLSDALDDLDDIEDHITKATDLDESTKLTLQEAVTVMRNRLELVDVKKDRLRAVKKPKKKAAEDAPPVSAVPSKMQEFMEFVSEHTLRQKSEFYSMVKLTAAVGRYCDIRARMAYYIDSPEDDVLAKEMPKMGIEDSYHAAGEIMFFLVQTLCQKAGVDLDGAMNAQMIKVRDIDKQRSDQQQEGLFTK